MRPLEGDLRSLYRRTDPTMSSTGAAGAPERSGARLHARLVYECARCVVPDHCAPVRGSSPRPLKMEPKKVDPSFLSDISQVILYGEFLAADNPKVKYAVSLTETDLAVQKVLGPSPVAGRSKLTFNLKDCVGARSYRGDDNEDSGAYFSVYFYPLKKRWMSTGVSRQRMEQCFQVASVQDQRANLEEAEKWARAIRERVGLLHPPRDGEQPGGKVTWCF